MRLAHKTHDYEGMHAQRTTKPFQSNPIQKHCYMIIDRSYMTETMLTVILSTNAPTKRIKIKAINNIKKTIKKYFISFFIWKGSNLCQDCFCALFFAFAWRSRPWQGSNLCQDCFFALFFAFVWRSMTRWMCVLTLTLIQCPVNVACIVVTQLTNNWTLTYLITIIGPAHYFFSTYRICICCLINMHEQLPMGL